MPYYQIELTPLGAYYFGDERSFNSPMNANYYVKSRPYPQQSTLLGALRYDILQRHGLLQKTPGKKLDPKAADLIGERGFSPEGVGNFKLIRKISAVQLKKDNDIFLQVPMDHKMDRLANKVHEFSYMSLFESHTSMEMPYFEAEPGKAWIAKHGTSYGLIKKESGEDEKILGWEGKEGPLTPSERVGIIKKREDKDDESAFYRQKRYRMKEGWSFVFCAEIDDEGKKECYSQQPESTFPIGGERVPFHLKAHRIGGQPTELQKLSLKPTEDLSRVVLTSDAYVEDVSALLECVDTAIMDGPKDFRAIMTKVKQTEQYNNLTARQEANQIHRAGFSGLYQLVPRGSVFYVEKNNWKSFTDLVHDNNSAWTQIGYNSFTIIN